MISVVIPLYNRAGHVKRALDSVLAQTHKDFEVIVVNDGSTDGSEKVVESYTDPRIRLVHQKNAGVSAARNRGIAEARSDLIAFLDSDDEWLPEHLATIARLAGQHPQCGAYATAFEVVTAGNRRIQPSFVDIPTFPYEGLMPNYFHTAFGCQIVSSSTVAVPRRVLDICGSFAVGVRNGSDMDLWCRIALKFPIAFSTLKGAVVHKDISGRIGLSRTELGEFEAIGAVEDVLASGEFPPGVTRADLVEYMSERLLVRAMRNVMHGHAGEARRLLRKASVTRIHRGRVRRWVLLSYVPASLVNLALGARSAMVPATGIHHQGTKTQRGFGNKGARGRADSVVSPPAARRQSVAAQAPSDAESFVAERPAAAADGRQRVVSGEPPPAPSVVVSVVVPLYNKVRHIRRALDSVMAQSCPDFEVVVVNDGSTDGSAEVVAGYSDPRIRLVHQENDGVSAARNRGIAEARADIIAFLDADDEWLPEHLETVLRLRRNYPQCGAYATAFRIMASQGGTTPSFTGIPAAPFEGVIPNYFRTVSGDHAVWTSAVAVPRATFDKCGLFPVGEPRREDLDMWCRIALKYPIAFSTRVGAVYHQEADNRIGNGPPVLAEPRIVRTLEDAIATGVFLEGITRTDLAEYVHVQLITRAISVILRGYPKEARVLLRKASATRLHRGAHRRWTLLSYLPVSAVRLALDVRRSAVFGRDCTGDGGCHEG